MHEAAKALRTSRSTLARIISGTRRINQDFIERFRRADLALENDRLRTENLELRAENAKLLADPFTLSLMRTCHA